MGPRLRDGPLLAAPHPVRRMLRGDGCELTAVRGRDVLLRSRRGRAARTSGDPRAGQSDERRDQQRAAPEPPTRIRRAIPARRMPLPVRSPDRPRAPGDCDGRLCEIDEPCGRVWVDLGHGVPLACVEVVPDDCGGWTFGDDVDACGPRRLVKRNDLLFDLIRGCDLTRISEIGWGDWHRADGDRGRRSTSSPRRSAADGDEQHEYVTTTFWVTFSRPVRKDTLAPTASR